MIWHRFGWLVRSGALALFAQRVSRDARPDTTIPGYTRFNVPVTIRRARAAEREPAARGA